VRAALGRFWAWLLSVPERADECECYVCDRHAAEEREAGEPVTIAYLLGQADAQAWLPQSVRALLARGWRVERTAADGMAPGGRQAVTLTLAPPVERGE
jgi:hypothetical protein